MQDLNLTSDHFYVGKMVGFFGVEYLFLGHVSIESYDIFVPNSRIIKPFANQVYNKIQNRYSYIKEKEGPFATCIMENYELTPPY